MQRYAFLHAGGNHSKEKTIFALQKTHRMDKSANSFRLNSLEDPTDEQLQAVMEGVAEEGRCSMQRAEAELTRRLEEVATRLRAYRQEHHETMI